MTGREARRAALIEAFRSGKRAALARAISVVESGTDAQELMDELLRMAPQARRVGMTGPPGAGKSSLVAALSKNLRENDEEVGVVAVDPTSPYTGGALLGDRIRMNDLATDPGMFIRSMATRGSLGGLAGRTKEVVDLMDAFGFANILVETVGVGQTELDIASAADTVVVVLVPESGDGIQAMKAGLMEIADVFVVNKADRPGADRLMRDLQLALHIRQGNALHGVQAHHGVDLKKMAAPSDPEEAAEVETSEPEEPNWSVPVLKTSAGRGEGIEGLQESIQAHRTYLESSGELQRRRRSRAKAAIREVLRRRLERRGDETLEGSANRDQWSQDVVEGRVSPYAVAEDLARAILKDP